MRGAVLLFIVRVQNLTMQFQRAARTVFAGFLMMGIAACAAGAPPAAVQTPAATPAIQGAEPPAATSAADYRLGSGDKLRVIVYGEQDLSGEFDVTGSGKVSLPLIGQVQAAGLSLDEFESAIASKLKEGYLTSPKVSVEVLNYRPFYIIGEVDKPGEYPYTSGMNVLNAVAVAGGFTYRANQKQVYITRGGSEESAYSASQSVHVLPGDIVRVPERCF